MKNAKRWVVAALIAAAVVFAVFLIRENSGGSSEKYDEFAKCLTASGVKMYGAFWCSHCIGQKEMFGKSWGFVDYVECSTPDGKGQKDACAKAGITQYPTWEFRDGERVVGDLSFEDLARLSGCRLEG